MSYKLIFTLNALIMALLGLGLLFVPDMVLDQFKTETYSSTVLVARFLGLGALALGLVLWFAKDAADGATQKRIGFSLFVTSVIGLVLSLIGVSSLSGVLRTNNWMLIALFGLGSLVYGFMLFLRPRMKAPAPVPAN
jgi:hypothetical protein